MPEAEAAPGPARRRRPTILGLMIAVAAAGIALALGLAAVRAWERLGIVSVGFTPPVVIVRIPWGWPIALAGLALLGSWCAVRWFRWSRRQRGRRDA
jgi:hypothetical protein